MVTFRKAFLYVLLICGIFAAIIETTPVAKAVLPDSKFQKAMITVLRHEGGYTDDAKDPGGATNWGISLRFIREEKLCENNDCKGDKNEVINLTKTEADEIYYKDWYIKNRYYEIKSQIIMTKVLDFSINAGSSQANKLIKRTINRISKIKTPINGLMDNETIELINHLEPSILYSGLVTEEEDFYLDIVKRNPELRKFLRGWLTRANDL